ncbi:gliding motility-associated C-terminal domain-containing protein [Chryseobacterium sp. G0240]|uniref:T9SS type B sorting domain-containing protein n=1 Tax=Chryseobacterium sp. G0240 TaxID=2487066 RepID=UPI000F456B4B|nr:gliding motility-associated C-terminal domain-containing protein [Chryseobacterium sp. G0240]ROI00970.1 gliding motility-associated C-terminal domain-containing protein [Chryseobacterium sp. G0240]
MKRFLLSLVLIFLTINTLFAQRDTEHWFAPMAANSYALSGPQQALYFSTDSTTPFPVEIYSDNALLGTVTISKGSPQVYPIPTANMITSNNNEKFTSVGKGLYTKGAKPYFVNFRFSVLSHGEILTSKGKAGIGNKFYVAATPMTGQTITYLNFTAGILATEDNTTIKVSGYSTGVQFSNGTTGASNPTMTFTLNKGKAYIIEGLQNNGTNATGFIGAKIESDKPISVTNGNFNGQFALPGNKGSGSDIVMDQSVPTDRLGNEFVLVKGNGGITDGDEDALVIATENNTQVYVNGDTTPIATLNEGQWVRVCEGPNGTFVNKYINQGNDHYNMHIKTSKNAYVYQLLAGIDNYTATEGFNYIPPLNCFLPRKIDEISMVNILPPTTNTVKLNILTEAGATVTVNNSPLPATQGPYPVTGTTDWVSYSVPNATGNITVNSTKAVTAGIAGGSGAVGYGGYFAGFSSIPVISKQSGDCVPGIILELDDGYETYQWFRNGNAISGATANTYTPTQSGNYTVKVTMGTCPAVTTPIYKVQTCLKLTNQSLNACSTKVITPAFTSSTQVPLASTVTIITPPTKGTAVVNPNGTITYTPTAGYLGPDKIVYKFCGNATEFIDCEQVTLDLTVVPFIVQDATISACWYDVDPYAYFDLTKAEVTDYTAVVKKYYRTLNDLNTGLNEITTPEQFPSTGGTVYVKVTTAEGCTANAKIELIPLPIKKSPILVDQYICMDAKTNLDAGPGYDSYEWSTGATTSGIREVGVGEYFVILGKNGCFLKQIVKVKKVEDPVIQQIEITNNTATVIAAGGKPPYKYAIDGTGNWQDSNTFTGLSRGQHTFYVKDAYDCTPVAVEVTVPNLLNAITPNGDNVNDYIDYSELSYKENLSFVVYDRYGNKIFTGNKFNNYKWDGKHFDKKIQTGTYWYHINWNEPNKEKTPIKYTGWILVKNRD